MTSELIAILALGAPLIGLRLTSHRDTQRHTPWPYNPPFQPAPGPLTTTRPFPAGRATVPSHVR